MNLAAGVEETFNAAAVEPRRLQLLDRGVPGCLDAAALVEQCPQPGWSYPVNAVECNPVGGGAGLARLGAARMAFELAVRFAVRFVARFAVHGPSLHVDQAFKQAHDHNPVRNVDLFDDIGNGGQENVAAPVQLCRRPHDVDVVGACRHHVGDLAELHAV